MNFRRRISPRGAIADFIELWRAPQPYRWQILGLSVALTFTMMMLLIPKSERIPPARPEVTFISTWEEGRTDEEIIASNIENQRRKDEAAALAAERQARRREAFRALGKASGFDVDELERQFADEETAGERAETPAEAEPAPQSPPAGE
jgi:hypothetical protein